MKVPRSRTGSGTILPLVLAGLFLLAGLLAAPGAAIAQDGREGGGLLRFLFQRSQPDTSVRESPRQIAPESPRPRQQRQQPRRAATTPAAPAATAAVAKAEDARTVLVVGDFLAGALADGLTEAFVENAHVVVRNRSNGSSGLVRQDYYDWPGSIGAILDSEAPKAVIVLVGSNDRQQMNVDGARERLRSDGWTKAYEARANAIAKAAADRNVPLIWVGALPFRPSSMSSDMLAFNDIFRRAAEAHGGEFVSVWDGFVDENGVFVTHGPDMNGQPAQLRASDGINVTRAGRRKMAFYVEKPLGRLLGNPAAPSVALPDADALPADADADVENGASARTVPVSLVMPAPSGNGELLGATILRGGEPRTIAERLAREGMAPPPGSGRADDFGRRPRTPPATAAAGREDAAALPQGIAEWVLP